MTYEELMNRAFEYVNLGERDPRIVSAWNAMEDAIAAMTLTDIQALLDKVIRTPVARDRQLAVECARAVADEGFNIRARKDIDILRAANLIN